MEQTKILLLRVPCYVLCDYFGFAIFSATIFSAFNITLRNAERFFAKADFGLLRNCLPRTSSNIPLWRTTFVKRCTKFWELSFSFFFTSKTMLCEIPNSNFQIPNNIKIQMLKFQNVFWILDFGYLDLFVVCNFLF